MTSWRAHVDRRRDGDVVAQSANEHFFVGQALALSASELSLARRAWDAHRALQLIVTSLVDDATRLDQRTYEVLVTDRCKRSRSDVERLVRRADGEPRLGSAADDVDPTAESGDADAVPRRR